MIRPKPRPNHHGRLHYRLRDPRRPETVRVLVILLTLGLAVAACTKRLGDGPQGPAEGSPSDPRLAGTWVSDRDSQLGPGSMRLQFECTGQYRARVRLFLGTMRILETGDYWTSDTTLHLTRATGETTDWRYRFDGPALLELEEAPGEWHAYQRKQALVCGPGA